MSRAPHPFATACPCPYPALNASNLQSQRNHRALLFLLLTLYSNPSRHPSSPSDPPRLAPAGTIVSCPLVSVSHSRLRLSGPPRFHSPVPFPRIPPTSHFRAKVSPNIPLSARCPNSEFRATPDPHRDSRPLQTIKP